jgi:hypothetical protein
MDSHTRSACPLSDGLSHNSACPACIHLIWYQTCHDPRAMSTFTPMRWEVTLGRLCYMYRRLTVDTQQMVCLSMFGTADFPTEVSAGALGLPPGVTTSLGERGQLTFLNTKNGLCLESPKQSSLGAAGGHVSAYVIVRYTPGGTVMWVHWPLAHRGRSQ